jgi:hypothetical protein
MQYDNVTVRLLGSSPSTPSPLTDGRARGKSRGSCRDAVLCATVSRAESLLGYHVEEYYSLRLACR